MHHAFVIEAGQEEGIEVALQHIREKLEMTIEGNPDVVVLRYGLLSIEEARSLAALAAQAPFAADRRAIVIAADRVYQEAQNALLKLFEEPSPGTHLFFIVPVLGGLLPTLLSRVQVLDAGNAQGGTREGGEAATEFLKGGKETRSAMVKRLTNGKDEESRRKNRDDALALLNGIEASLVQAGVAAHARALTDLAILRGYLHDRSAPVKQILEHVALTAPHFV